MNSITLQELFGSRISSIYHLISVCMPGLTSKVSSSSRIGYYLGHYLFEEDATNKVKNVIDGQQRLTTVVIFIELPAP